MAYPAAAARETAERLDRLAVENNVAVLGTGINPGFILDTLVILLTGVCSDIHSISARRVNDLAPYGPTVLAAQGVGLAPDEFDRRVESGTVVGHIGFPQSIHMIASSVGWRVDRLVETRREPIVSSVQRETPFVRVEPGQVAGCLHTAVAYRDDRPVITLEHPQQIQPQLEEVATGDRIEIRGTPDIRLSGHPEVPGGEATIALAVNLIPRVLNAGAGLHTMADLPIPAAMLADARRFVAKSDSR
jgi:4-hydroxy-tetrahydrodipicolinate reductase